MRSPARASGGMPPPSPLVRNTIDAAQLKLDSGEDGLVPLSDFRELRMLGRGASGEAYLLQHAQQPSLYVVSKRLSIGDMGPKDRTAASTEVRILASVHHPVIIKYYGSVINHKAGLLDIVMEYADGGTMADRITEQTARGEPFATDLLYSWLAQMLWGLEHLHEQSIIHRDLKPGNVFLTQGGMLVRIGDFGISRHLSNAAHLAETICGTPYYLSPEMVMGKPYSTPADIWSLGCILYELVFLRRPFAGKNLGHLVMEIVRRDVSVPRPPDDAKAELAQLVQAMLIKDPEERPTASELLAMPALTRRVDAISRSLLKLEQRSQAQHDALLQLRGRVDRQLSAYDRAGLSHDESHVVYRAARQIQAAWRQYSGVQRAEELALAALDAKDEMAADDFVPPSAIIERRRLSAPALQRLPPITDEGEDGGGGGAGSPSKSRRSTSSPPRVGHGPSAERQPAPARKVPSRGWAGAARMEVEPLPAIQASPLASPAQPASSVGGGAAGASDGAAASASASALEPLALPPATGAGSAAGAAEPARASQPAERAEGASAEPSSGAAPGRVSSKSTGGVRGGAARVLPVIVTPSLESTGSSAPEPGEERLTSPLRARGPTGDGVGSRSADERGAMLSVPGAEERAGPEALAVSRDPSLNSQWRLTPADMLRHIMAVSPEPSSRLSRRRPHGQFSIAAALRATRAEAPAGKTDYQFDGPAVELTVDQVPLDGSLALMPARGATSAGASRAPSGRPSMRPSRGAAVTPYASTEPSPPLRSRMRSPSAGNLMTRFLRSGGGGGGGGGSVYESEPASPEQPRSRAASLRPPWASGAPHGRRVSAESRASVAGRRSDALGMHGRRSLFSVRSSRWSEGTQRLSAEHDERVGRGLLSIPELRLLSYRVRLFYRPREHTRGFRWEILRTARQFAQLHAALAEYRARARASAHRRGGVDGSDARGAATVKMRVPPLHLTGVSAAELEMQLAIFLRALVGQSAAWESPPLRAFLEVSALSFRRDGWDKGREGTMLVRTPHGRAIALPAAAPRAPAGGWLSRLIGSCAPSVRLGGDASAAENEKLSRRLSHTAGSAAAPTPARKAARVAPLSPASPASAHLSAGGGAGPWFVLKSNLLCYSLHPDSEAVEEVWLFDRSFEMRVGAPEMFALGAGAGGRPLFSRRQPTRTPHIATLLAPGRSLQLQAPSERELGQWLAAVRATHAQSDWTKPHAHGSYAPARRRCAAAWHAGRRAWLGAVTHALDGAKSEIFISARVVSPQLRLLGRVHSLDGASARADARGERAEPTLGALLAAKAAEGVAVRILLCPTEADVDAAHSGSARSGSSSASASPIGAVRRASRRHLHYSPAQRSRIVQGGSPAAPLPLLLPAERSLGSLEAGGTPQDQLEALQRLHPGIAVLLAPPAPRKPSSTLEAQSAYAAGGLFALGAGVSASSLDVDFSPGAVHGGRMVAVDQEIAIISAAELDEPLGAAARRQPGASSAVSLITPQPPPGAGASARPGASAADTPVDRMSGVSVVPEGPEEAGVQPPPSPPQPASPVVPAPLVRPPHPLPTPVMPSDRSPPRARGAAAAAEASAARARDDERGAATGAVAAELGAPPPPRLPPLDRPGGSAGGTTSAPFSHAAPSGRPSAGTAPRPARRTEPGPTSTRTQRPSQVSFASDVRAPSSPGSSHRRRSTDVDPMTETISDFTRTVGSLAEMLAAVEQPAPQGEEEAAAAAGEGEARGAEAAAAAARPPVDKGSPTPPRSGALRSRATPPPAASSGMRASSPPAARSGPALKPAMRKSGSPLADRDSGVPLGGADAGSPLERRGDGSPLVGGIEGSPLPAGRDELASRPPRQSLEAAVAAAAAAAGSAAVAQPYPSHRPSGASSVGSGAGAADGAPERSSAGAGAGVGGAAGGSAALASAHFSLDHELAVELFAAPARDVARHFAEVWNHVRRVEPTRLNAQRRPSAARAAAEVTLLRRPSLPKHAPVPAILPAPDYPPGYTPYQLQGELVCQAMRSAATWSAGCSHEASVHDALVSLIAAAQRFVYVESALVEDAQEHPPKLGAGSAPNSRNASLFGGRKSTLGRRSTLGRPSVARASSAGRGLPGGAATASSTGTLRHRVAQALIDRICLAHALRAPFHAILLLPLPAEPSAAQPLDGALEVLEAVYAQLRARGVHHPEAYLTLSSLHACVALEGVPYATPVRVLSRIAIADDRVVVAGTATITDRDLLGDRDAEVGVRIEGDSFARSLRTYLWCAHLGIRLAEGSSGAADAPPGSARLRPSALDAGGAALPSSLDFEPTLARMPQPEGVSDAAWRALLDEPTAEPAMALWRSVSQQNAQAFSSAFGAMWASSRRRSPVMGMEDAAAVFGDLAAGRGVQALVAYPMERVPSAAPPQPEPSGRGARRSARHGSNSAAAAAAGVGYISAAGKRGLAAGARTAAGPSPMPPSRPR